ncbi:MAG: helix-turn-helix domain-containing protein [Raineya sp.]|jgi:transcriptional regulator with XRE-family HTH domain|nr:helix-turn-helix domain-containing protein [Raineya sp.]
MNVGLKIKELRTLKNMSVNQVAEKLGVTKQAVYDWEKGKSVPSLKKIEEIAVKLNVEKEYFTNDNSKVEIDKITVSVKDLLTLKGIIIGKLGFNTYVSDIEPFFPKCKASILSLL